MPRWRLRSRPVQALQIEVTSRCNRSCSICPRSTLARQWCSGDLSSQTWRRLEPDLVRAAHVHLQGWGEPLLHPDIRSMARDARAAGCTVGLTTNADLLDQAAEWIVAEQVSRVTVSVAGSAERHRRLRDGSELGTVWAAVRRLADLRDRKRPRIHVSYLLTRDNLEDIPATIEAAASCGADELSVAHLDCTPTPQTLEQAVVADPQLLRRASQVVANATHISRQTGLHFRPPPLQQEEVLTCALDPRRFVFVSWDARVGPCVQLLLPLCGPQPRCTPSVLYEVEPVSFGTLGRRGLGELLDGPERRAFTAPFRTRIRADARFRMAALGLTGTVALARLDEAEATFEAELRDNPFPTACRGCHKADGW